MGTQWIFKKQIKVTRTLKELIHVQSLKIDLRLHTYFVIKIGKLLKLRKKPCCILAKIVHVYCH